MFHAIHDWVIFVTDSEYTHRQVKNITYNYREIAQKAEIPGTNHTILLHKRLMGLMYGGRREGPCLSLYLLFLDEFYHGYCTL